MRLSALSRQVGTIATVAGIALIAVALAWGGLDAIARSVP